MLVEELEDNWGHELGDPLLTAGSRVEGGLALEAGRVVDGIDREPIRPGIACAPTVVLACGLVGLTDVGDSHVVASEGWNRGHYELVHLCNK